VQFREVLRRRRMVRRYQDEPVPAVTVGRVLDAARRAPSAGFAQGQHFVVVTDAARRRRLAAEACDEDAYVARGFEPWVSRAPVLVVPCVRLGDYLERYTAPDKARSTPPADWAVPFWWVDGGAALMLLLLAAVDEGLAAGFLAADAAALRRLLGIPADVHPLGVVTLGQQAPDRRSGSLRRGRRPFGEVVHAERWGEPAGTGVD
jgi:nitroreductase